MSEPNIALTGSESRFLVRLITDPRILIRGNGLIFAANLLLKINSLHLNQPLDQSNDEALHSEQIVLSSIVIDKDA